MTKYQEDFNLRIGAKDKTAQGFRSFTKSLGGMLAGIASVTAAMTLLKSAMRDALEHHAAFIDLSGAVERSGVAWEYAEKTVRSFTSSMERMSGVADEKVAFTLQRYLGFGMDLATAMDTVKISLDFAAHSQRELSVIADMLGKTFAGNATSLAEYAIYVDQSASSSEKFAEALDIINKRAGGAAATHMSDIAGQVELLDNNLQALSSTIGSFILNDLEPLVETTNEVAGVIDRVAGRDWSFWDVMYAGMKAFFEGVKTDGNPAIAIFEKLLETLDELEQQTRDTADWIGPKMVAAIKPETAAVEELTDEWLQLTQAQIDYWNIQRGGDVMMSPAEGARAFVKTPGLIDQKMAIPEFSTDWLREYERIDEVTMAFGNATMATFQTLGDAIADTVMGVQVNWDETLKHMLASFAKMISQLIMKAAALAFLSAVIPGFKEIMVVGGTTLGKPQPNAGGQAASSTLHLHFEGDIIGEEQYVRERIVPQIESAARAGFSRIVVRG